MISKYRCHKYLTQQVKLKLNKKPNLSYSIPFFSLHLLSDFSCIIVLLVFFLFFCVATYGVVGGVVYFHGVAWVLFVTLLFIALFVVLFNATWWYLSCYLWCCLNVVYNVTWCCSWSFPHICDVITFPLLLMCKLWIVIGAS